MRKCVQTQMLFRLANVFDMVALTGISALSVTWIKDMYDSRPTSRSYGGPACILSAAATGLAAFIAREGGDADHILGVAGTDLASIERPMTSMTLGVYCRALEQAALETGNENFGLRYGQQFQPSELGLLGYLAMASSTVGEALRNMGSLFHHHQQSSQLRVVATGEFARVEYQIADLAISSRRQDAEFSISMFFNILRHAMGSNWRPREIHFEHVQPAAWTEHQDQFGAPVYFSQPTNALVLTRAELDAPMPNGDARLLALLQYNLQQLGLATIQAESLIARVQAAIRQRLNDHEPTLDEICQSLGMATWKLQRRLRTAGYTYQQLLLEERKELSLDYLRDPAIQISELSFLLGYSEISAFSRAFHRWHGVSPTEWRRHQVSSRVLA